MDQEELKSKIIKDIKKSGFPSEMKANLILQKHGWTHTQTGSSFLDKDLNKSREIDITAYKNILSKKGRLEIGIELVIEVKKTEKPWVIFCQKKQSLLFTGVGWGLLNFTDNITSHHLSYEEINDKNLHANSPVFGTSYYEAFKEPSETSQIYSSLITSCKAAVNVLKLNSWKTDHTKKFDPKKNQHVFICLPIVVLDGLMFQSKLNDDGEIELIEASYSPIRFEYSSANYEQTTFYPEIITLEGFSQYIKDIEIWHNSLFNAAKKNSQ